MDYDKEDATDELENQLDVKTDRHDHSRRPFHTYAIKTMFIEYSANAPFLCLWLNKGLLSL